MTGTWLRDHLLRTGHMTETGVSRSAKLRTCRCGEQVVFGLDDVMCALEVHVDPVPVSPLGEALALIEGRRTLALHREGAKFVLDVRSSSHIVKRPAGAGTREDVLRQHRCDTAALVPALAAISSFAETTPSLPPGSPAPF